MANPSKAKKIVTWSLMAIVLALFTIKTFFIGYYRIPQNGMSPTLPAGSILFTNKNAYSDASSVKRGDIIIFVREQNGRRYNYIWRVIGLPGDKVQTSGESLIINGQPVGHERATYAGGRTALHEQISDAPH